MKVEFSGQICDILNASSGDGVVNPRVFWFSDHGKAVFQCVGSEPARYASFLVSLCANISGAECDFRHANTEFPNPGDSKAWSCGCKCVAVAIPDLEAEGVDVADTMQVVMKEAIDRMKALGG